VLQYAFQGLRLVEGVDVGSPRMTGKRCAVVSDMGASKRIKVMPSLKGDEQEDIESEHVKKLRVMVEDQNSTVTDKAVKSDDARVPLHLWNLKVLEGCAWTQERFVKSPEFWKRCFKSMDVLQGWLLGEWKK